jgi:hypothetical protein
MNEWAMNPAANASIANKKLKKNTFLTFLPLILKI